jgi:hypothetical protein
MAQRDRNKVDDVEHNAPKTMVAAITGAERGIDKDPAHSRPQGASPAMRPALKEG